MASELMEALEILEKEKDISKESILSAIENALVTAYKNQYKKKEDSILAAENVFAKVDEETGEFFVYAEKTVVDEIENGLLEISLEDARKIYPQCQVGDVVRLAAESKEFSRIATQNAKNVLMQNLREREKDNVYEEFLAKEKNIATGVVQRFNDQSITINLGKADGILNENEQVKSERLRIGERVKVYVLEVKNTKKSLRILVSRTHPELVRKLFESEVTEVKDGTVEIVAIAREAGSRTKMAVWSNDPDVDPVGACVGMNGMRVNAVVSELKGEKIDIINWSDNPAILIENALSPAKVISVLADDEEKTATVIVPDYQLSLAIGKEGQNARLAARLTGFKIDILNETQAADILDEIYEGDFEGAAEDADDFYGSEYEGETDDPQANEESAPEEE
ncbi:MAG: transcription termination/antitermination protein NusA [Lachnospiraceae bacterium]|jgi:N utilization substance protein A|nr:transcription termination/antitermination protein NusA [Lachnospiraceae bacterium]MBR3263126.1 transcription termination/antitermination protein NusA [Lachnospiraceae bacterium]